MLRMRPFLLALPEKLQVVIIVGATVISAFAAALAARALFDANRLVADTGLTVAVYEVLGTIYAILLAFAVSGVWQNFSAAVASVQTEAGALLGLVHIVDAFPSEHTKKVHSAAVAYATEVIAEWQALAGVARGAVKPEDLSYDASMALLHTVQFLKPANDRETVVFEQALVTLNSWLDARRKRLQSAGGSSAAALWPLLIGGAFVLFAFHGLFAAKSNEVWAALLLGLSAVVGLAFYLIFSLDSPFTGSLSAHVGPFQWVVNSCRREKPLSPSEPGA
jgi:Protein of unknown function (DUF4239)